MSGAPKRWSTRPASAATSPRKRFLLPERRQGPAPSARVRGDPVLDHRSDAGAPLAAVEDAVVADVAGEVVLLLRGRQVRHEVERGAGLAEARDVVALAFDG